jgi:hypothetical protein
VPCATDAEDLTQEVKDIAAVLGRTQVSVRVMLFRARAVLAQKLATEPAVIQELKPEGIAEVGT